MKNGGRLLLNSMMGIVFFAYLLNEWQASRAIDSTRQYWVLGLVGLLVAGGLFELVRTKAYLKLGKITTGAAQLKALQLFNALVVLMLGILLCFCLGALWFVGWGLGAVSGGLLLGAITSGYCIFKRTAK